jgi:hypothetical protein
MHYQIKLDMNMDVNSLTTLLGALGSGPHNFVRPIIDSILQQAKEQEEAAKAEEPAEQITEAGLTD